MPQTSSRITTGTPRNVSISGCAAGKPQRLRVVAEVLEPQRPRLLDQQPEDAATAGQVPDRAMRVRVDAGGDEALELLPALVEHAHGRVARAGDLARDVEQLLQDRLDVELGDQSPRPASIRRRRRGSSRAGSDMGCCGNYGSGVVVGRVEKRTDRGGENARRCRCEAAAIRGYAPSAGFHITAGQDPQHARFSTDRRG